MSPEGAISAIVIGAVLAWTAWIVAFPARKDPEPDARPATEPTAEAVTR